MATKNAAGTGGTDASRITGRSVSDLDAEFERRLDRWLSYYRSGIGTFSLVLVMVLITDMSWLKVLVVLYVAAAAAVIPLLRWFGNSEAKFWIRSAILLIDVLTVSIGTIGLGVRRRLRCSSTCQS